MRICTKAKVYLISRPSLHLLGSPYVLGLLDFLREQKLDWPTEPFRNGTTDVTVKNGGEKHYVSWEGGTYPMPAEQLTEVAGRSCYMSFGSKAGSKRNADYLDNLIYGGKPLRTPEEILDAIDALPDDTSMVGNQDGTYIWQRKQLRAELRASLAAQRRPAHGSVLEHANFSFLIIGAGRGFSHELVRHRAGWAYSQLSTRYCDFEREEAADGTWDPGFTVPPLAQLSKETTANFVGELNHARNSYRLALMAVEADLQANPQFMAQLDKLPEKERKRTLRKAARGAARDLLPNGTEAIMVATANARALWNTIVLRASEAAEAEIRAVFVQIARIMEQEMPAVFKGLRYQTLWDGSESVIMPRDHL